MANNPNFSSLNSIFSFFKPIDLTIAEKMNTGNDDIDMYRYVMKLILEAGNAGCYSVKDLLKKIEEYRTTVTQDDQKKRFDFLINFYSTLGGLSNVTYPYICPNPENTKNVQKEPVRVDSIDQIVGIESNDRGGRDMSIMLCTTPYISPMIRDAEKAEIFLNFLPPTIISRCVPYLELEFSFDRKEDQFRGLRTASLLKFLLGGQDIEENSDANNVMASARNWRNKTDDGFSIASTAGMELFTSPQTLVNMDPVSPGARYTNVLDPTRPFASLESVSINVSPTSGVYSYKKANAVIKLHDRSRLSEIADLIQPTTYTSTSVWLTYGWRHPYEPNPDPATKTYGDYINNNMLIKEAYGLKNASFSFDSSGQVTVNLELYTKSISELKDMKINRGANSFFALNEKIKRLAKAIHDVREKGGWETPTGGVEIRAYTVLDAAENGTFPELSTKDVKGAINSLQKSIPPDKSKLKGKELDEYNALRKQEAKKLEELLNEYYKTTTVIEGQKQVEKFLLKQEYKRIATATVQQKFEKLNNNDPFLITDEKFEAMKKETSYSGDHPILAEIKDYNAKYKPKDELIKDLGVQKKVVSFGKLFSVFMGDALFSIDTIEEYEIFFYCLNDKCGPASYTNVAEFPIDVPVFMSQYRELIMSKGTEAITVEEFFRLAIDSQFGDQRAPAYGFLSQGIFEPYDEKEKAAKLTKDGKKKLEEIMLRLGTFVMPQIEVYVETTHEKFSEGRVVDILRFYESPGSVVGNASSDTQRISKKICRIHAYDKTVNSYKGPTFVLRAGGQTQGNFVTYYEVESEGGASDKWIKEHEKLTIEQLKEQYDIEVEQKPGKEKTIKMSEVIIRNNQDIKNRVSRAIPTIVVGMNASSVYEASMSSKQEPALTAAQLLGHNAGKKPAGLPSGGAVGNLPLRVIPAALTMKTLGCPLLNYSQRFFVDFNTGTTLDNIYGISGLTHALSPGKFDSSLTMAFFDAYGSYESARTNLAGLVTIDDENSNDKSTAGEKTAKPGGKK